MRRPTHLLHTSISHKIRVAMKSPGLTVRAKFASWFLIKNRDGLCHYKSTRWHSFRMHTTRLETVRVSVSVATTRYHSTTRHHHHMSLAGKWVSQRGWVWEAIPGGTWGIPAGWYPTYPMMHVIFLPAPAPVPPPLVDRMMDRRL